MKIRETHTKTKGKKQKKKKKERKSNIKGKPLGTNRDNKGRRKCPNM